MVKVHKMDYSATSARKNMAGNQAKTLLKNVIRHTDTHNRRLEEADMWNMHTKMKEGSSSDRGEDTRRGSGGRREGSNKNVPHKDSNIKNSFLYDNREFLGAWPSGGRRGSRKAHMDDDDVGDDNNTEKVNESTFWMRQVYKAEAADEDRWGHAGYKELYPHHFDSDRSEGSGNSSDSSSSSSGSDDSRAKRRKRKRKKSTSRETHRKSKKRKKEDEFKKKKRKKKSKDESDEDEDDKKRRKKRKKEKGSDRSDRKRRKKKKTRKVSSASEDNSDSDDDKRKWRRK